MTQGGAWYLCYSTMAFEKNNAIQGIDLNVYRQEKYDSVVGLWNKNIWPYFYKADKRCIELAFQAYDIKDEAPFTIIPNLVEKIKNRKEIWHWLKYCMNGLKGIMNI